MMHGPNPNRRHMLSTRTIDFPHGGSTTTVTVISNHSLTAEDFASGQPPGSFAVATDDSTITLVLDDAVVAYLSEQAVALIERLPFTAERIRRLSARMLSHGGRAVQWMAPDGWAGAVAAENFTYADWVLTVPSSVTRHLGEQHRCHDNVA